MRKLLLGLVSLVLILLVAVGIFFFVYAYPVMSGMKKTNTINYDKQLTLVMGGGGNSGILVCDTAVLVIDTKMDKAAEQLANQVKQMAGNRHIIVVNTHVHQDHTEGNKYFKGQTIIAGGNYDKEFWRKDAGAETMPTTWIKDSLVMPFGDDTITILNLPWNAHTQSDVVVYLQKRKMLFGGDLILNHKTAAVLGRYHADPEGFLRAFDYFQKRFDIQKIVPGHGDLGGPEVLENFRTYFLDMKKAATDPAHEKELLAKYDSWTQIPFFMSPAATENSFKK